MARDETRDVFVLTEDGSPEMSESCISVVEGTIRDEVASEGQDETRYVPHSQLADLERQLAEAKTERDYWRKKHKEDNEGLMFQLGRNLEFAQAAAFRHGATEPHATIKCIQIIDEHAESLQRQLADRDDQMQGFIRKASEVPGLSAELDQVTWERDQLRKTLAGRDAENAELRKRVAELEDELRCERNANDDSKDYDFQCGY